MTSSSSPGGCWPTQNQQLLLRACLLDGTPSLESWHAWQGHTDVDFLDFGSARLLPLLMWNLERQGVPSPLLARYKSVSRHHWLQNQFLFEQAKRLLELFAREDIPTLVLKGGALVFGVYPKVSTRPMNDFDILVPTHLAPRAFEIMLDQGFELKGWKGQGRPPQEAFALLHAYSFSKRHTRLMSSFNFDIHRHVWAETFEPHADKEFWRNSVELDFGGIPTRALCPEDALLHVCAHGVYWDDVPPIRWIPDAVFLLRAHPSLDWNRVVEQTRRHGQSIPMRRALRFLSRLDLGVSIPPSSLREIAQIPTSRLARREQTLLTLPRDSHSLAFKFCLRLRSFRHWNATNPFWQRPFSFPRYLQLFWGLPSRRQVLAYGLKRLREMHLRQTR